MMGVRRHVRLCWTACRSGHPEVVVGSREHDNTRGTGSPGTRALRRTRAAHPPGRVTPATTRLRDCTITRRLHDHASARPHGHIGSWLQPPAPAASLRYTARWWTRSGLACQNSTSVGETAYRVQSGGHGTSPGWTVPRRTNSASALCRPVSGPGRSGGRRGGSCGCARRSRARRRRGPARRRSPRPAPAVRWRASRSGPPHADSP